MKIYKAVMNPEILYAAKILCLTQRDTKTLRVLTHKILKRMRKPKKVQEKESRLYINYEKTNLIEGEDIVQFIKA